MNHARLRQRMPLEVLRYHESSGGNRRFGAGGSRGITVRVIDFHFVGSFGLEQALRHLEREETRRSLRRTKWSDRETGGLGLQCRRVALRCRAIDYGNHAVR
jgi:hypothetical protein